MLSSPSICVAGSINMDLVFRTPRMPGVGETVSGHEFIQIAGGKGANQAVAASRQGANVSFIGCVGDDANGRKSLEGLTMDGIDCAAVSTIPHCATGVAGIFVDDLGRNSIVIAPGANARLSTAHIDAAQETIRKAQLLICQCEIPLSTIEAAITIAHKHGVKVVFNPAPAMALPDHLFHQVSYLILNETEATQISGVSVTDIDSAMAAARQLIGRGVGCVLLTMGEQGVCVAQQGQFQHQFQHLPGIPVDVVDTTAAGDTFVGAFATAIGSGMHAIDAATHAQYCAALAVTQLGAQSSIPHQHEVNQFKAHRTTTKENHGQT